MAGLSHSIGSWSDRYHFGAAIHSESTTDSTYTLAHPDAERQDTTRVTWEIEPVGDSC